ncbi:MAG TPA: hypothetical protein VFW71_00110 [Actinomycetota bacterium]|nr:hypothetical protein [Actinomycetota bacterium]
MYKNLPALQAAIELSTEAADTISQLEQFGCPVRDDLAVCQVTIPEGQSAGVPFRNLVESLYCIADRFLRYRRDALSFELSAPADGELAFVGQPLGDPEATFQGNELRMAQRAWEGNLDAALSLEGTWDGTLAVNLGLPLQEIDPSFAWRSARTLKVVVEAWKTYPWWRSQEIISDEGKPLVIVVLTAGNIELFTPAFAVLSADRISGFAPPSGPLSLRRQQLAASAAPQLPANLPLPEELIPVKSVGASGLQEMLVAWAEACAWTWLSNTMRLPTNGMEFADLEFFGYQRRVFHLNANGYKADASSATNLYTWATAEIAPDRVLAVRQVVSLADGPQLPARPGDVIAAAAPLYQALREGAMSVVLESQRQVRTIAVDAARQSAEAALAAAKSTAERTIASLGAVAGIAVAQSTTKLSVGDARWITIGISLIFVFLAFWSIAVEGPAMKSPLDSFKTDIPVLGRLLPEEDRREVLNLEARVQAYNAVCRVRVAVPFVYFLGALITLAVAHLRFALW